MVDSLPFGISPENCFAFLCADNGDPQVCVLCGVRKDQHQFDPESESECSGLGIVAVIGRAHATRVTVPSGFELDWAD